MKEFLSQEIAIYNHFSKLATVFIPQLDTKVQKMSSINHLTEGKIGKLHFDVPFVNNNGLSLPGGFTNRFSADHTHTSAFRG